jgi:hypothetical protein
MNFSSYVQTCTPRRREVKSSINRVVITYREKHQIK